MKLLSIPVKLFIALCLISFIFYKYFFDVRSYQDMNQKLSSLEQRRSPQKDEFVFKIRSSSTNPSSIKNLFRVPEVRLEQPKKTIQVAPPIPFVCIGFLKTNGGPQFVIEYNGTMHMLHEGDQILDYQLISVIAEKGWYKLIFLYKPFNQTQFLMVSDAT